MTETKTFKDYCKDAKRRLKSGFWQNYKKEMQLELDRAEKQGVSTSKVKEYYTEKVRGDISGADAETEKFYSRVKTLLDTVGEVSDALGRLTDKDYYNTLSYEEKQRYNLDLSSKYLKAVERYKKEKELNVK